MNRRKACHKPLGKGAEGRTAGEGAIVGVCYRSANQEEEVDEASFKQLTETSRS